MFAKACVLLVLGLQALSVLAAPDIDCTDYLVDQCFHPSQDSPQVEVLHNVTMDDCQFFCNEIYKDNCTFFISDKRQNLCEIWTIAAGDYEKDCVKHEGPVGKEGDLAICKDNTKDCNAFREGYCMFEGNLLEHLNSIMNEETCQLACQHVRSCQYYVWDSVQHDCQLLDSDAKQCDMVKGIKGAKNYNLCK